MRTLSYWTFWFIAGFLVYQAVLHAPNNVLSWDVFGYYLYLPAAFLYHDLGLEQMSWVHTILEQYDPTPSFYQATQLESGRWVMKYSAGMAVSYVPFFAAGHLFAWLAGYPMDGFSLPYQGAVIASSLFYTVIGLWMSRLVLRKYYQDGIVSITLLLIAFGTNYYHQNVHSLGMSHNYLFAGYAVLLWLLIRDHKRGRLSGWTGLVCGLMILARPSEILCLVLVFFWFGSGWKFSEWRTSWQAIRSWRFWGPLVAVGCIQIAYWWYVTGSPVYYSYKNPGEGFDLLNPHTGSFLFSFRKGWLIYTPMAVLALIGFLHLRRTRPRLAWAVGCFVVLNVYLLSSWTTWWYAESFGQRSMVQSYALLAIPLAATLGWMRQYKWSWVFPIAFLVLNQFQTWQYNANIIHGSRMTAAAYFRHFARTEPLDEEARSYLLVERSTTAEEHMPVGDDLRKSFETTFGFEPGELEVERSSWKEWVKPLLGRTSFEPSEGTVRDTVFRGTHAFRTDGVKSYSPALSIPFDALTDQDYAWVRISAWVFPTQEVEENPFVLVYTFQHGLGNYKYRVFNPAGTGLEPGRWNRIEAEYMTPEIRSASDPLSVYVWNQGASPVYVDEVRIEVYEPVEVPYRTYWKRS